MFVPGNLSTDLLARIIGQDPTGRDYVYRAQMTNVPDDGYTGLRVGDTSPTRDAVVMGTDDNGNPVAIGTPERMQEAGALEQPFGYQPPGSMPMDSTAAAEVANLNLQDQATAERYGFNAQNPPPMPPAANIGPMPSHMAPAVDAAPSMREAPAAPDFPHTPDPTWVEENINAIAAGDTTTPGDQPWYSDLADAFIRSRGYDPDAVAEGINAAAPTDSWPEGSPENYPFTGDANLTFGGDGQPLAGGIGPTPGRPPAATTGNSPAANGTASTAAAIGADPETGVRDDQTRAMSLIDRIVGESGSDRRNSIATALIAAGGTIMSTGGSLGQAIGAGVQAGVVTYQQAMKALKEEEIAMRELQMDEEAHAMEMAAAELALERARSQPAGGSGSSGGSSMDGNLDDLFMTDEGRQMYGLAQDIQMLEALAGDDPVAAAALARAYGDVGAYARGGDAPEDEDWLSEMGTTQ